jgi:hypothetical protein
MLVLLLTAGSSRGQAPAPGPSQPPQAQPPQAAQPPQVTQPPQPAQIDRNGVLILIRSTLLALDQANKTGNYTVLRDLGAPGFQVNTAARLAEIFAKPRNDKIDLSATATVDPQLSLPAQIEPDGRLHVAGLFPSAPAPVNFDLIFTPVHGQWRLLGLSVTFGPAGPATPAPKAPAAPSAPLPSRSPPGIRTPTAPKPPTAPKVPSPK